MIKLSHYQRMAMQSTLITCSRFPKVEGARLPETSNTKVNRMSQGKFYSQLNPIPQNHLAPRRYDWLSCKMKATHFQSLVGVIVLFVFSVGMSGKVSAGEMEALAVLRQNAPAIAAAINADPTLRSTVGAEKWPQTLKRLAEFSKNKNPDCQEALRIIGDTMPRVKSRIGNIQLDGNLSEWSESIPPADFVRRRSGPSRDVWAQGAAALVRQDRVYIMIGLANAAKYFGQADNEVWVTIDCDDDQTWDVCLSLTLRNGRWVGKQMPYGGNWKDAKPLPSVQGSLGEVAEVSFDIKDFVPLAKAKPAWTLNLEAKSKDPKWRGKCRDIPVFNENARDGVASWPYLRTFLCLCADKPLEGFELTAAAIAIMSSTMYMDGDDEVRRTIRVDNAEFLELARSIDAWQSEVKTEYRLKDYPLEAQLAWATRIRHDIDNFLENSREPGKKNNLENYKWVSVSMETLKKLKDVAIKEGLTDASLATCSERIDKWVKGKEEVSFTPKFYRKKAEEATDPKKVKRLEEQEKHAGELIANADIAGYYRGKPVSAFKIKHSESILEQIERHGHNVGSCGNHTQLCVDLMRTLGIAPLHFRVLASREDIMDHAWPGRYDPSKNVWLASQGGRKGEDWWFFFFNRPPVFSYATEAEQIPMNKVYQGSRPFPLFFCRELQGFQVKTTSQTGTPTMEIREWMLTPGF
jgi:hypothetical protein